MCNLFVYGTLLSPEIVRSLTGKKFLSTPAKLQHFKRYIVKSCDYPAIIPFTDSVIMGMILENVDADSLKLIEFYEGDEYTRKKVIAIAGEKEMAVYAFLWKSETHLLEEKDWDLEIFESNSLKNYLEKIIPETIKSF